MKASPIKRVTDDTMQDDIEFLIMCVDSLAKSSGHMAGDAVLLLMTAATVSAIRAAPSGVGVALDLKELILETMNIARGMNTIQPQAK